MKLSVLQIKEQKVLVDELCNLKKNRVSGGSGKSQNLLDHIIICAVMMGNTQITWVTMLVGWCSHVF